MAGIIDLLPLLEGWSYKNYEYSVLDGQPNIVVKPGNEKIIIEEKKTRGWLLIVNAQFTTPFAKLHILTRVPQSGDAFDFAVSPTELLIPNLTHPGNIQFWCADAQMVLNTGRIAVAAAAAVLSATAVTVWPDHPLTLHAPVANASNVFVGNTSANAAVGLGTTLSPGDSVTIKNAGLLSHVWVSGTAGDFVEYMHEVPDTINGDSVFGLNLTPSYPLPYTDGFSLSVENPAGYPAVSIPGITGGGPNPTNVNVAYYNAVFLKINNEAAFQASLAKISGVLR